MDKIADDIKELSDDTMISIKELEKHFQLFRFDDNTNELLHEFLSMMKFKATRIANPRNIHDIKDNIKMKVLKNDWDDHKNDNIHYY